MILGFISILSAPVDAYTDDAVIVVGSGGSRFASIYDLQSTPEDTDNPAISAVFTGQRTLLSADVGIATFSDIKILPDGSHLLSDGNARGFLITETDGKIRTQLRPPNQVPAIASASVVSYIGPGQPLEVFMADNSTSSASVYDITRQKYVWTHSFISDSFRARVSSVIVLPNQKFAVAVNWPALNLFAIDIFDKSAGEAPPHRRIANKNHNGAPASLTIQPAIDEIRDITARIDGSLLVTTRFSILALAPDGQLLWNFDIGTSDTIAGELATARWLPSGRIAVASFEPGKWTQAHTNHRIHWLQSDNSESPHLIASSEPLTTAPVSLDALDGHGATGTFGFHGDDEIAIGDASSLELSAPLTLNKTQFEFEQRLKAEATIHNPTSELITLERAQTIGVPGPCDSPAGPARVLSTHPSLRFNPDAEFTVQADVQLDETFDPGIWCIYVSTRDRFLLDRTFENPVEIYIKPSSIEPDVGPQVPDTGYQDQDETVTIIYDVDSGCGCHSASSTSVPSTTLLILAIAIARTLKRRRRHEPEI